MIREIRILRVDLVMFNLYIGKKQNGYEKESES